MTLLSAGGDNSPQSFYAHPEDSIAPAERIMPAVLAARLEAMKYRTSSGRLLDRAWLYYEYALATPDFEGDEELFKLGREDLEQILNDKTLVPRSKIMVNAKMLLAYEDAFKKRANSQQPNQEDRRKLQKNLGEIMLDFMDGPPLKAGDYGFLAEQIAPAYLLNGDHFPYLSSFREEANMVKDDNHDIYTLHEDESGQIKKVPISIKHYFDHLRSDIVVTLKIGRIALEVASQIPGYKEEPRFQDKQKMHTATRLAADNIICHALGDSLSVDDKAFLWGMTARLQAPIDDFARRPAPDYGANSRAIEKEIARREIHNKQKRAYRLIT